jgi:hypothetical protein
MGSGLAIRTSQLGILKDNHRAVIKIEGGAAD